MEKEYYLKLHAAIADGKRLQSRAAQAWINHTAQGPLVCDDEPMWRIHPEDNVELTPEQVKMGWTWQHLKDMQAAAVDGKLQYNANHEWQNVKCRNMPLFNMEPYLYRRRPEPVKDWPPRPTQSQLDSLGVEIVGDEPRGLEHGDLYVNADCDEIFVEGFSGKVMRGFYNGLRWIVRPKQPAMIPWGREEWRIGGWVTGSTMDRDCAVESVGDTDVKIGGVWYTHREASEIFTQTDGTPCTKESTQP